MTSTRDEIGRRETASESKRGIDPANRRFQAIEARLTALEQHLPSARLAPKDGAWPLDTSVAAFELSSRVWNCLNYYELRIIGDLVEKTQADLLRLPNFGRKSLRELEETLFHAGHRLKNSPFKRSAAVVLNVSRFSETYCSQCGKRFGPGNEGYSHCDAHEGKFGRS